MSRKKHKKLADPNENHEAPATTRISLHLKQGILASLAALCCLSFRLAALHGIDVDNDEALYSTRVGFLYSEYLRHGQIRNAIETHENFEHPPLIKFLFGVGILTARIDRNPEKVVYVCRWVSVLLACAETALLSLWSPFAAILFSLHSWQIFYSAKAYLDGPSSFFALAAILFFIAASNEWNLEMLLSAAFLGIAVSSKYINAITAGVILLFLLKTFRSNPIVIAKYIVSSILSFYITDPAIWLHPLSRLTQSLFFHQVQSGDSALYRQYLERFGGIPGRFTQLFWLWQNHGSYQADLLPASIDRFVLILSFIGLPFLYRRHQLLFYWYVSEALFLVIYPIKWPHYTLVFIPAIAISAAEALRIAIPNEKKWAVLSMAVLLPYAMVFGYRHRSRKPNMASAYNSYASALSLLVQLQTDV